TMSLPKPFRVVATQNPTEPQGAYPLPESQLDRFLMRIDIGYPEPEQEIRILRGVTMRPQDVASLLSGDELLSIQDEVEQVHADPQLLRYLLAMIAATRCHEGVSLGVSPRGAQALFRAAQASALLDGRGFLIPDDIKGLAIAVCSHRLRLSAQASFGLRPAESARGVMEQILSQVSVPL
ncbi:MAG: AAA family ATPase, partial [Acidobacteriota bacterium]